MGMGKRNARTRSAAAGKKARKPAGPKKPRAQKPLASGRKRSQDDPEGFKKAIAMLLGKDRIAITELKKQLRDEKWKNVSNRGDKLEKRCKELGFGVKHEKVAEGEGHRTFVFNPDKYEEKKDAA